jgi:hypothetical protein
MRFSLVIGGLFLPLLLNSCGQIRYPNIDDLELVSVAVLQQSQIPDQDKFWAAGTITAPLVRVQISSTRDFQKLAAKWGYNIDNRAELCQDRRASSQRPIEGFPGVYDRFGLVYEYHKERPYSGARQAGRIIYSIYFELSDLNNVNFYHYDLMRNPEDVCITIRGLQEIGGDFSFASFRSNTIVVSKSAVVAALHRAGMR